MRFQNSSLFPTISKAILINALVCSVAMAVAAGQVDDFEDTTPQGWTEGVSSPNKPTNEAGGPPGSTRYLQNVSFEGFGGGSKMTMFNVTQWSGDYISAGITEIRAMVKVEPLQGGPLSLRVGFRSATEFGMQGWGSFVPVVVADDGTWYEVVFPIESADLRPYGSFRTYEQNMSNVGQFRIYHSTNASWQGASIAATMGIDNIKAFGPSDYYEGWLYETGVANSMLGLDEEYCFGDLSFEVMTDMNWLASSDEEVCWGRNTTDSGRTVTNPPGPHTTNSFAVPSTQPLLSAGGNLYELFNDSDDGPGEERAATALFEPQNNSLLMIGGYEFLDVLGAEEAFGFVHLLTSWSPDVRAARNPIDLEGTSWRAVLSSRTLDPSDVDSELALTTVYTFTLDAGGFCTFNTAPVHSSFVSNRDILAAAQFDDGITPANRFVLGATSFATASACTFTIDGSDFLNLSFTLTPQLGLPTPITEAFVISDDNRYLVQTADPISVDDNPRGVSVGFRAASGAPDDFIDGDYLAYLTFTEFEATGTGHSMGQMGGQEHDSLGRGLFSFDSTTPATPPMGEVGNWYACNFELALGQFTHGLTGSFMDNSVSGEAESDNERINFSTCVYSPAADGLLKISLVVLEPGSDPSPIMFTGYFNDNGEVFSVILFERQPGVLFDDLAAVFQIIGMSYTGDPDGDEDLDGYTNLEEFQMPAPLFAQPLLLRRSTDQKWFTYVLSSSDIADSGSLAMTRSVDYSVVSRADFDGDGNSDVLLRDLIGGENGRWVLNTLDGTSLLSEGFVDLTRNTDWAIVAIKDFSGDGRADVLLRNSVDGRWLLYLLDAQTVLGSAVLTMSEDLTDVVVGTGDFNGDGSCDVLLRRADGTWLMYALDGLNVPVEGFPAMTTNLLFTVQAVADFDGDENDDVLVRRDDGTWFMYTMNGAMILTSGEPAMTNNTDFGHRASVDFDGDGRADILLRRTDGKWFMYTMNGFAILNLGTVDATKNLLFTIVSTQDFDGDGHADLLLRRTDGRWVLYTMNGPFIIESLVPDMTRNEDWVPYAP